jgi:uncharacterized protein (TIRG00374 family)
MKKKILIVLSLIGIFLFIHMIIRIGLDTVWNTIKNISPENFVILMFLRFIYWYLRTLNWKLILEKCSITLPFWIIFKARVAAFSINYLTPSANIGGEATRVMVINNRTTHNALPSVILDKTIELLATIFFVMAAVAIAIYRIPMPPVQKFIYAGFILVSVSAIIFILRKQRQGLLKWIIEKLGKLRISFGFIRNNMGKIREIDENISAFYKNSRKAFYAVLALYFLQMVVWTAEIFFTLRFLGMTVSFLDSFLIVSLGSFAFIMPGLPGGIGVYELSYLAIFKLLGLDTTIGMALVIARRVIALIWAGAGLGLLASFGISGKISAKPEGQEESVIHSTGTME